VDAIHKGVENAGRLGILPVGWDIKESSGGANPENAQLLGLREFSVQDISRLLNVPPSKLGLRSGESYASLEASQRDFVDSCLVPWGESFEQSLSLRLLTDEEVSDGYQFRHSFDALIRGDTAARTARNSAMFDRGCLRPDEWRVSENLPPLNTPGSRTTYTPLNMTPSDGDAQKESPK
jgi:HK97 family phage portal protein